MFSVGDYVFNQKNWTPWQSNWLRTPNSKVVIKQRLKY